MSLKLDENYVEAVLCELYETASTTGMCDAIDQCDEIEDKEKKFKYLQIDVNDAVSSDVAIKKAMKKLFKTNE